MARYTKREYRVGDWFLGQRSNSPAWYRCSYDKRTRSTERHSLGTDDFLEAKRRLDAWWAANFTATADDLPPSKVKLATLTLDYWTHQGSKLRSSETVKIFLRYWTEYWGDCSVADVRPAVKQEAFRDWLKAKGLGHNSVNRCLEVGRAAIQRGWKRGVISSAPFIQTLPTIENEPMGRPLSLEEARALFQGATQPHIATFIIIGLATGARPEAITDLTWEQIDFEAGIIRLNPDGRVQTKKHRPTIKLPHALAAYLRANRQFVHTSTRKCIENPPFVITFRGKRVSRLDTGWRKAVEAAGLDKRVTPYSLRHTVARYLRSEGVGLEETAAQLGHKVKGLEMTMRYAPHAPDYLEKASAALNRLVLFCLDAGQSQANDNQANSRPSGVRWK